MPGRDPSRRKDMDALTQVGLALTIPSLLAVGPLVGYLLGELIRHWTGWGPWVGWLMTALGMIAGIRESVRVIKKIS